MFTYNTSVKLHHTDAAGRMFFGSIFNIIHDAYEVFLESSGISIAKMLREEDFLLPIIHTDVDYKKQQCAGDKIIVNLRCDKIGKHSFTLSYTVLNEHNETVNTAHTSHAVIDKISGKKISIPAVLLKALNSIQ